jgi:hypothetical protein
LCEQGLLEEALERVDHVVATMQRVLSDTHPATLFTLSNQAFVSLFSISKFSLALCHRLKDAAFIVALRYI